MAAVTERQQSEARKLKNKAKASLALLIIAVISISTATYAWFTLSNSTSVQSMVIEVGTGTVLKAYAGVNVSENVDDYFAIIRREGTTEGYSTGEIITDALPKKVTDGVTADITSLKQIKLWPVTSGDGIKLYTQGGNASSSANAASTAEDKYFLQLRLTFISDTEMDVYLNGDNSSTDVEDGTLISPGTEGLARDENAVKALRISFESSDTLNGKTCVVYEPVKDAETKLSGNALKDAKNVTVQNTFTDLGNNAGRHLDGGGESPVLFSLEAGIPKEVFIRAWVEGEDKECVNTSTINIEKALMNIRFRFCGADANGDYIETAPDKP